MAWDKGRYYTRSKKVNGRVEREYIGAGRIGELAARMDAVERQQRDADRAAGVAMRSELAALDAPLNELNILAELVASTALMAAGFRQHKRGEWRKQRVHRDDSGRRDDAEGRR